MGKLIEKIIPPANYQNRNGFNNIIMIEQLSQTEKEQLEQELMDELINHPEDTLIVETLAYMKSKKAVPMLFTLLEKSNDEMFKLIITASIYEITKDENIVNSAIDSFKKIDASNDSYRTFRLVSAFYHLSKFKTDEVIEIINKYINDKEYLIAYNAKKVLESL